MDPFWRQGHGNAKARCTLLICSLLIGEDFWRLLDFSSDRSIFSTFAGGYKKTLRLQRKIQTKTPEILTN